MFVRTATLFVLGLAVASLSSIFAATSPSTPPPSPALLELFETRIRPLLAEACFECHSAASKKLKGGLRLDSREALLKGGDSGPALSLDSPDASRLLQAVRYKDDDTAMPPKGRLRNDQIADLELWIRNGAPWPETVSPTASPAQPQGIQWDPLRRNHWAFRPAQFPIPPPTSPTHVAQTKNPIDAFVLSQLHAAGLSPSPPAAPSVLLRRAYLNLIGVPPPPEEVEAFRQNPAPDAFARIIDRLLASPKYGERWARHWLDVARYSDGLGGFLDSEPLPEAWRYRDWVVEALNADLPYNQFVQAQIAGDLAPNDRSLGIATGFFAVGPTYISDGGDPEAQAQAKAETLADRVDTFSRAFLGLTVACARCHDHKFDPITMADYYALAGVFNNTATSLKPLVSDAVVQQYDAAQKEIRDLEKRLAEAEKKQSSALSSKLPSTASSPTNSPALPESLAAIDSPASLRARLKSLKETAPPPFPRAHMLSEQNTNDMPIAIRGDLRKPGDPAPRRYLQILAGEDRPRFHQGSGRAELAQAVTDTSAALAARVIVNRVWLRHFGFALARSPSNFGALGEKPTHPDLLEWLVSSFIESGWSLKQLHRSILLSSTWQQSSRHSNEGFARDGENRSLWRMNPRTLEVEAWRDSLLAVTGELSHELGGPPLDRILDSPRRTLYATVSRNGDRQLSDEFLRLFDFPAARVTSESRASSTVPQQYLFLLNSPFMHSRARALAQRLHSEFSQNPDRIRHAYTLLYARPPSAAELQLGLDFLERHSPTNAPQASFRTWESYAHVLLTAHEFRQIQ